MWVSIEQAQNGLRAYGWIGRSFIILYFVITCCLAGIVPIVAFTTRNGTEVALLAASILPAGVVANAAIRVRPLEDNHVAMRDRDGVVLVWWF